MNQPSSDPSRLDGKLALITGGGTGIGAATARVFSAAGATVIVTGRRPEPLEEIALAVGGHAHFLPHRPHTQIAVL